MKYVLIPMILFSILNCSTPKKNDSINGYWMQEGYGVYLEISDSIYKMYDVTEMSCQPSASGSINNWSDSLSTLLDLYNISSVNSQSMVLEYGITSYKFNKLSAPLKRCDSPIIESADPKLNFDVFWHTFKENYAYSKIRKVDWDMLYEENIPLITKETSQVELFGYIAEILDAIKDEHISLRVPDSISNAYLAIRVPPEQQENPSENLHKGNTPEKNVTYKDPRSKAMKRVMELFPETKFKSYHKDLIRWGKLNNSIGYIQINGFNGFSKEVVINDTLDHDDYWEKHWQLVFKAVEDGKTLGQYLRDEVSGMKRIKESILSEFSKSSGLIIDLRFNPGGTDKVALDFLSSFTKGEKKAFTKRVWNKGESSFESSVFIPESPRDYDGQVVVLTSPQTGSSAETFVLASQQLPNFTLVGSNTMGIFSDVLQKRLPNGWNYGLSNEIYQTDSGENYEYTGIPPHHKIEYSRNWDHFHKSIIELTDSDPAIDLSLAILGKRLN